MSRIPIAIGTGQAFSTFSITAAPIYVIGISHNITIKIAHNPMDQLVIQDTALLLEKNFDLKIPDKLSTEEELVALMTPVIHQMLNRDFEKLLQVCYRIDLGEEKVKSILHTSEPETLATDLARALVERQILKVEIRRKYSGG